MAAVTAEAATSVTIGNAPDAIDGSHLNAQNIANILAFTDVIISAGSDVTIVDPIDLSSSIFGPVVFDLTLVAPTVSVDHGVAMGVGLNAFLIPDVHLNAATLHLNGTFTSGGAPMAGSRVTGTATQVNVLGPGASLAQALAAAAPGATIAVSPGQYRGNYVLAKPVTLVGDPGDPLVPGAGPAAPELLGAIAGGTLFTVTAVPGVIIEGFRLGAGVDGDPANDSAVAVASDLSDGLAVTDDSFDGFTGPAVRLLSGSGVVVAHDTFANAGGATLATLIDAAGLTSPSIHDNVVLSNFLVDTGPGGASSIGAASLFDDAAASHFQLLAGQFTLPGGAALSSVEAWMAPFSTAGSLDVTIRSDAGGLPGASIFTKTYALGDRLVAGWDVFPDYAVVLAPGTYWLALEPVAGAGLRYAMPTGAPSPLASYAFFGNDNPGYLQYLPNPGLGLRVAGTVPETALSVATLGAGSGTVTSSPAGLSCLPTCLATFDAGTVVTLTASPAPGSSFAGWSGACAGTGACAVTMDASKSVDATFAAAPPVIQAIAPTSGPTSGGTLVTITGTGFAVGATVTMGGVAATSVAVTSGTAITATAPPHAAGLVGVTVTNADGQGSTLAGAYRYLAAPVITAITPAQGSLLGGTLVAISGSGFRAGARVTFGGVAAAVTILGPRTILVRAPAHAQGPVAVTVVNPDGQSATAPGAYAYVPATPTGLTALGGPNRIALAWNAAAGASGYSVLRANTALGPFRPIGAATGTSFTDAGLASGVRRFYVVRATSAAGTSASSNVASARAR